MMAELCVLTGAIAHVTYWRTTCSERCAAAVIIAVVGIYVVLLVRFNENNLGKRLASFVLRYLIAKSHFMWQSLLLSVRLTLAF